MKKSFLFILGIVLCGQLATAQSISYGVKAGANFATLSGGINTGNITSYHAGAVLEVKLPFFGIQPELLYSSVGATVNGTDDIRLDYISVPVVLKFYVTKLSFEVGPQFSYLVNDNLNSTSGFEIKNSDIGVLGGLGLNIAGGVFAQARYVVGVSNNSNFGGARNNVFQLSMGYKF